MNLFIEYPKCSTCKNAKKWLESNNVKFTDRDITKETPLKDELRKWIDLSKKDIKKWFNTSGLKYKELGLKDKLGSMSDNEKIEVLASYGMLIKRPIFASDNVVLVGFKEDEWKGALI